MGFKYLKQIPSVKDILSEFPLNEKLEKIKQERDKEIKSVLEGKCDKFMLIIGPCSADNEPAVLDYVGRLKKLQDKTQDTLIIIPRVYTNKPRTIGVGYKGMGHQPDPMEDPDLVKGLKAIRKMHIKVLEETGLSAADEMLYPANYPYLADLLSYVTVGARSVENQQHRLTISGINIPSGMKNPTSGDIRVMINSILAAQAPHVFVYNGWEVQTAGNPFSHAIIRGAVDHQGRSVPNYHYEDLHMLSDVYNKSGLLNPSVIVDTNHSNSDKNFGEQPRIAMEILHSRGQSSDLKKMVKGLMIESYIESGRQDVGGNKYGKSITDPCLGWPETEKLILNISSILSK